MKNEEWDGKESPWLIALPPQYTQTESVTEWWDKIIETAQIKKSVRYGKWNKMQRKIVSQNERHKINMGEDLPLN